MEIFKLQVFEDDVNDQRDIKLYITRLNKKLSTFQIKVVANYETLKNVKDEIQTCESDLIILDLIDDESGEPLGKNAIKHNINEIPILIYTSKAGKIGFEINNERQKYPYLVYHITKSQDNDYLEQYLFKYILSQKLGSLCFIPYNENDLSLRLSLEMLGINRVNSIINQINNNLNHGEPVLYPMSLGFSGAILFKLKYENCEYVLKMSTEIDKIKKEHENARKLYHSFPDRLLISIEPDDYYSFDDYILGYFMKSVKDSETLFAYIINTKDSESVNIILNDLFLNPKGLKHHYSTKNGDTSDWTAIFNRISESKFLLISNSYNDVRPLVKDCYQEISIEDFRRLAIQYDYDKLSVHTLLEDKYRKNQVLVHGDFHAKNIMIQDETYVKIIDTGLMEYAHWSSDISRLIVNLFIGGVDYKSVKFFKVDSIRGYIEILCCIMDCKPIPLDGNNDNVFTAINWLVSNANEIYDYFELFEYQLGLMKEFLQVSYRFDTVPANRRAFSLIAADMLMKEANTKVSEKSGENNK